ncbi:unnamed protein product [Merluccius merluccius]
MASPDGNKDYSGPDEGMSPGQKPVPLSSGAPAGGKKACKKRKWTEPDCFNDPRVDQQQLGEMHKTIEYMAANQHRLLDLPRQTPLGVPPHPAVSIYASNNLDKTNRSGCGSVRQLDVYGDDDEFDTDSQMDKGCPESSDLSTGSLLAQAAAAAGLPPPSPPKASALDRNLGSQRQALLPVYPDFVTRLQKSWAHPKEATAARSALSILEGAAEHGLDGVSKVGKTFALLAGAPPTSNRVTRHPNKKCRTTDGLVAKAYQSIAMASRLANTNTLLLVYLESLIRDLESKGSADHLPEMIKVVDTVIQGASSQARVLGCCPGGCYYPWRRVRAKAEAALDEAQKVRLRTQSIHRPGQSRPGPSRPAAQGPLRGIETPSGLVPWNTAPPGVLDGCGRGFPNIGQVQQRHRRAGYRAAEPRQRS